MNIYIQIFTHSFTELTLLELTFRFNFTYAKYKILLIIMITIPE